MLKSTLLDLASEAKFDRIPILQKFFQTHKWWYAEWDKFLGLYVPDMRRIAKKYYKFSNLADIQSLMNSEIHEHRFVWLIMLNLHYKDKKSSISQKEIFDFYLQNTKSINNRDLVDVSAPNIVWDFLRNLNTNGKKNYEILYKLAKSQNLREKRIAVVSTLRFIKNNDIVPTIELCKILINDQHHLIHKACGRMLREARKTKSSEVELFLDEFTTKIPRTMLRYAIEAMGELKRKNYLWK